MRHADSHIHLDTAFDKRIAFISIDNAVETCIRNFLSLPISKSGIRITKGELDAIENSFPGLTALLWSRAGGRLTGIDEVDVEHYHRLRNKLYHDGTGLSVDEQYLLAYRQIAILMLNNLFGIDLGEPEPAPTLERLILLWNQIEELLSGALQKHGIERGHTYVWEEAIKRGLFDTGFVQNLTELRMIRNKQVHSSSLDPKQVAYAVDLAQQLLKRLKVVSAKRPRARIKR